MILSRVKPALNRKELSASSTGRGSTPSTKSAQLANLLEKRDYTGAITFLEFLKGEESNSLIEEWIAYAAFHLGNYKKALIVYEKLLEDEEMPQRILINIACCYFYLGMYEESKTFIDKVTQCALKARLNVHLAHKLDDEDGLVQYHQRLKDCIEDQMSLAALHYMRAHYQESIDIYKKLLLENRENLALNVYIALCYNKMDFFDVSLEIVSTYLNQYGDSLVASNLKACNNYRLSDGATAEADIRAIVNQNVSGGVGYDLLRHNLIVFRGGREALQVFPSLVGILPEARFNLVIYYLKHEDYRKAYDLIKDLDPTNSQEYILKGVVNACVGQELNSPDFIKQAKDCFQLVGSSQSESDTIHGRQCMAAVYFLAGQYEEVLMWLTSIKSYFISDDVFNFNYAQAKTACEQYRDAEETLLLIKDPKIRNDLVFISCLGRCYVMNGKPERAWELYLKMEASTESFNFLLILANDSYRMGEFWFAAKAFDMLERLQPNPEFWEGKRGAIVGVFQGVILKRFPQSMIEGVIHLLRSNTTAQAVYITNLIKKWADENRTSS